MTDRDAYNFNPNGIRELIDAKYQDTEYNAATALQITLDVSFYSEGQLHRIDRYKEKILDFLDSLIKLNSYTKEDLYSVMYHMMISSCLMDFLEKLIPAKTGRNEPCPCSSGKKYKNCCIS